MGKAKSERDTVAREPWCELLCIEPPDFPNWVLSKTSNEVGLASNEWVTISALPLVFKFHRNLFIVCITRLHIDPY
uniref:Bel1 homeotic protein n=1 Tax=Rhizophora mucronata TaxID=61149 RepID=A0A2P2QXX2_RHIMU